MKNLLLFTCVIVFNLTSLAQSLSGNLNAVENNESLGYGNVDIYNSKNELVASVLTDAKGNFNVALDTGTYEAVVNYAGYKTMRKKVKVRGAEKTDFSVKRDPSKPKPMFNSRAESHDIRETEERLFEGMYSSERIIREEYSREYSVDEVGVDVGGDSYSLADRLGGDNAKATKGALTAGEINDFSKWEMWQDISGNQLKAYQEGWKIFMKGRYAVEVQSQAGLPIADARVVLKDRSSNIYSSRTDNTGKAELWLSVDGSDRAESGLSMDITYQGKTTTVKNVTPITSGMNHVMIEVECEENNNVDIAFVVDATGSMGDELNYLKAEMNDIIYQSKQISSKLNFRFANVFYRDQGSIEQYLTRTMNFSRVLSESVQYIESQSAGGGGDYEEAVEVALDTAINKLSWSESARTRLIFLILDAPPHNTDMNQEKLKELIQQAADKGIRIVPIGASGINKSTEYLMRTLALGTNGTYTFLTDHSGIGNEHIEPTTDDYKVETLNNLLVRILKSYTYMPDCEQNIPELELDYPDSLVNLSNIIQPTDTTDRSDSTDVAIGPDRGDTIRGHENDTLVDIDSLHWNHNNGQFDPKTISWKYYPNPTNGIVNITASVDIDELYITDLSGKLLQTIKELKADRVRQIDLSNYVTGIYLIRYPYEDTWISGKVVLHR